MQILEEEILEPIFRYLRFKIAFQYLRKTKSVTLLDLGCGKKISFYYFAKKRGVIFKKYIGIDPLLSQDIFKKNKNNKSIILIKKPLEKKIPLADKQVDYVVGFAFLEHIKNPQAILPESVRVLKDDGRAIFTTPTPKAKKILEFLARLNLVSKREIKEHKNYFNKEKLLGFINKKNVKATYSFFEFALNSLLVIEKINKLQMKIKKDKR